MATVFDRNDQEYLAWLRAHPAEFVVNTRRRGGLDYMVLHRAGCSSISRYTGMSRPGGFTERTYIKICSDHISALEWWTHTHGRIGAPFSVECSRCEPRQAHRTDAEA